MENTKEPTSKTSVESESKNDHKTNMLTVGKAHSTSYGELDTVYLNTLTDEQNFGSLLSNDVLYKYFDTDRCLKVVGWTYVNGFKKGIVPILYMYIRNMIKPSTGMVISENSFNHVLIAVVFMLMRTAQDVVACKRILASKNAGKTYNILRRKLNHWLDKFKGTEWAELSTVIATNDKLNPGDSIVYPSPVWCTNCNPNMFSTTTIYFGTPNSELVHSANETVAHIDTIRKNVAHEFVSWVKGLKWNEFLSSDYPDTT